MLSMKKLGAYGISYPGCLTMYWWGIMMRWGEHELQTTRPHFLYQLVSESRKTRQRNLAVFSNLPAMMLAYKYAKLCVANGTVCNFGVRLPPRHTVFWRLSPLSFSGCKVCGATSV